MKNIETLRKITLGVDDTQEVQVTFLDQELEFTMRPLTDGELTQLQTIEKKPLVVKVGMMGGKRQSVQSNDVDINTGEFTEAQAEAMYQAIAWSLSVDDEVVTIEDIKALPAGLPGVLFEQVMSISKLSDDDLTVIKSFRED